MAEKFQAVVIGGGPGGYVCAIRLSQLGIKTACIESRGSLGGTCLNVGCIPSKNLLNLSENYRKAKNFSKLGIEVGEVNLNLDRMMKNKEKAVTVLTKGVEFLFKKNKVTYFKGTGSFKSVNKISILDEQNKETIIETEKTVISTGSMPVSLPGIKFDEKIIVSSTGALTLQAVPKKMVVVGGGYIGLEMGSVWSRLGSEVHIVEFLENITPGMDREISTEFMKILKKQGINFHMQTKVEEIKKKAKGAIISTSDKDGKKINFDCDVVLISVGRKPNTNNLNLESIGVELDDKKRIKTDKRFQTNINNIYAIGDVIEGPMLAHKAEDEGIAVAENIAGQSGHVNYDIIPGVVYTTPEVASIGKTEEQLKKANIKYKIGKFLFMANSRAKTIDEAEGFVKILADEATDRVLGAHIIGSHAGELIAEIGVGMEFGASAEDIARTCHAHPTFSEAIKEAALSVDKRAIHS
jgi:dihydrolipoamide dehydrogenase